MNAPADPSPEASETFDLVDAARVLENVAVELGVDDLGHAIVDDTVRRMEHGALNVTFVGEIKHGKSSLINAIVGEDVLPIGVVPTTGRAVSVRSHEAAGRWVLSGDKQRALSPERFADAARGKIELEGALEARCATGRIPEGLVLVDTPGFNDIDAFRAAIGRSELGRADIIVVVLDATAALSRSEAELLRAALAALGAEDDEQAPIVEIAINRADLVDEADHGRIVDHAKTNLAELFGPAAPNEPVLTNARAALENPAGTGPGVQGVKALRARLRALAGRRAPILPRRAKTALLRHGRLLEYYAAIQARAIRLEDEAFAEELAAVQARDESRADDLVSLRTQIDEGCSLVRTRSRERLDTFRENLDARAREQIRNADLRSLTDVVPGAIADAMLDEVERETKYIAEELDALTHELLDTHGDLARRRLLETALRLGFRGPDIYVEPPSVVLEAGTIGVGLVGTAVWYFGSTIAGLSMAVAGPLATVILREKSVRDARKQALGALPGALEGGVEDLHRALCKATERFGDSLHEHLELADRQLGEQLASALKRARERLDACEHDGDRAREELAAVEDRLQAARRMIEGFEIEPSAGDNDE